MSIKNTYWFTVASGSTYRSMAGTLSESLKRFHIELDILGTDTLNRMESKYKKIQGIVQAPKDCDRIVFLDADTVVLNPQGIDRVQGAWKIPWKIPAAGCIPKNLDPRKYIQDLDLFYRQNDLHIFRKGSPYEGIEWNSGVIAGRRDILVELANEWAKWWDRILNVFDGHFRRDQVSFRIAYYHIFKDRYRLDDLPADYNWVVSYHGLNPNANILHRTMVKDLDWLDKGWDTLTRDIISHKPINTRNRVFDLRAIQGDKPCLYECIHFQPDKARNFLYKALRLKRPEKILFWGRPPGNTGFIREIKQVAGHYSFSVCLDTKREIDEYDFIIFDCGLYADVADYVPWIDRNTVCCFFHTHDLEFYQILFQFTCVRFIDYSFGIFSNSSEILGWDFFECKT
ncbi:MAG: hypothetical protein JXB88_19285 [Spirochaetales bacterium]|nr:hypothetical protein [Spirochaetales bacterium]